MKLGTGGRRLRMLGKNEKNAINNMEIEIARPFMSLAWKKIPKETIVNKWKGTNILTKAENGYLYRQMQISPCENEAGGSSDLI